MVQEGTLSYTSRPLSNMEKQGFIKSFEFTYELAWNLMRDYSLYQGHQEIRGSRDAIRLALSMDLISDGETWMDMLESRNITSHTYDDNTAEMIMQKIAFRYFPAMVAFQERMNVIANEGWNFFRIIIPPIRANPKFIKPMSPIESGLYFWFTGSWNISERFWYWYCPGWRGTDVWRCPQAPYPDRRSESSILCRSRPYSANWKLWPSGSYQEGWEKNIFAVAGF